MNFEYFGIKPIIWFFGEEKDIPEGYEVIKHEEEKKTITNHR